MSKIMELVENVVSSGGRVEYQKALAACRVEVTRMEAELAEEKRLFTQLCKQHEAVAMEAQLLRGGLAALEGHGWKHVANEWADMATNGIQYMRNVKEGITTFDEALAGLAGDLEHCCEVSKGAREPAQPMTRHIHENAAQLLIEYFICAELGLKNSPGFTTEKQGELESESHSWAFWILEEDTTSYLHEDGRIEWCGTGWEAEPISQPAQPQSGARGAQPMTVEEVRAAGGIVHKDGNIFFTNIDKLNAAITGAKS